MVLEPPESVRKLQMALQAKAKGAPSYRFYLLYDKLYRKDVLQYAYDRCKANQGAPGVDKQDFADIAAYGEDRWLGELAEKLHRRAYRTEAVRRVWIPKAEGKKLRPLGIPRIADRVVMTAAVVVLEAIFEVDMPAEQHGYRPNLSAHTAVGRVNRLINEGHTRIIDADLADYFGSIPHAELLNPATLNGKVGSANAPPLYFGRRGAGLRKPSPDTHHRVETIGMHVVMSDQ